MDPNVMLLLKLIEIIKAATAGIKSIKENDPAAYEKIATHHAEAGKALDEARLPGT